MIDKELFYQKQVMNPYPTVSPSYTAYEKGFIEGWNKIKETLYTEEQVKNSIERARNYNDGWVESEDEIIQSLKEQNDSYE
jgi:hypothetical protein